MADTKLTALTTGTVPQYFYGTQAGVSKKFNASMVFNVKDFGALGDNSNNDTSAIQAAINAALTTGLSTGGTLKGSVVYFPPGIYIISGDLNDGGNEGSCALIGAGKHCCELKGYSNTFVIAKTLSGRKSIDHIANMRVGNSNTAAGTGAIQFESTEEGIIENCEIEGQIGVLTYNDSYCNRISNCSFKGRVYPAVGLLASQTTVIACSFTGWGTAIKAANSGFVCIGCRFEVDGVGLDLGHDPADVLTILHGSTITGNSFESNKTNIYCWSTVACTFVGNSSSASTGGAIDGGNPLRGLAVHSATNCVFEAFSFSDTSVPGYVGIDLSDPDSSDPGGTGNTFISCSTSWIMPPHVTRASFEYIQCEGHTPTITFADLPGQSTVQATPATEGMEFDISDGTIATSAVNVVGGGGGTVTIPGPFGGIVTGGGSTHCKVRHNGTNWTAMGK